MDHDTAKIRQKSLSLLLRVFKAQSNDDNVLFSLPFITRSNVFRGSLHAWPRMGTGDAKNRMDSVLPEGSQTSDTCITVLLMQNEGRCLKEG